MMTTLALGCKAPQLAGMACAVALADILNKRGIDAAPAAEEEPAPSTLAVLRRLGLAVPGVIASVAGRRVALAGPAGVFQGLPGVAGAEVIAVVDAPALSALSAAEPQVSWAWPSGSTATLLKAMYDFYGMEISRGIAGGLLAACLEETDKLASGKATQGDISAANALAAVAGIADLKAFAKGLPG